MMMVLNRRQMAPVAAGRGDGGRSTFQGRRDARQRVSTTTGRCRHGGGGCCDGGGALLAHITSDHVSHAQCHTARSESSNKLYASTNLGEYRSNCQWWQSSKIDTRKEFLPAIEIKQDRIGLHGAIPNRSPEHAMPEVPRPLSSALATQVSRTLTLCVFPLFPPPNFRRYFEIIPSPQNSTPDWLSVMAS